MQWLVDTSPLSSPWTVERMIGEIIAVWFSSVHQLAMVNTPFLDHTIAHMSKSSVFAIEDICFFTKHVDPLRQELSEQPVSANGLPLLDSFLKESARFTSIDASKVLDHLFGRD